MTGDSEPGESSGLSCPRCGAGGTSGEVWRVIRTRSMAGQIQRDRECRNCGLKATTTERFLNLPNPQATESDTRSARVATCIRQILERHGILDDLDSAGGPQP